MTPAFLAGTSRPPAASTVRVKICGLRSLEHAVAALDAGADFLGFNFAPVSKRRVDAGVARRAIEACRALPGDRLRTTDGGMVGIFVNQPPAVVEGLARACALDMIQLSGDEDAAYCREISLRTGLPVIKAVRLGGVDDAARVAAYTGDGGVTAILADAPVAGSWGGSGQTWDWGLAEALASDCRLFLAGGLAAGNVQAAIRRVRPWGVDVASGVETDGETDPLKVRDFVQSVKGILSGRAGE